MKDIKLTKLSECAGCGAKVGAGVLCQILNNLPTLKDPNLIVGFDKSDDACVYKINDDLAIVQTVDFFPPIADDPYTFGQIAATNALSDIFAMGGEAKLAMNVLCVAPQMTDDMVHELLRGGYEKVYEAGAIIAGGHTIHDKEPKYGLSVTGFVNPSKILTNSNAKEGNVLILTKPIGIGILTTANKADMLDKVSYKNILNIMCTLNKKARDIAVKYNITSCTDITGFGLLGHSFEMATGSNVSIKLDTKNIPILDKAIDFANEGILPSGMYKNRHYAQNSVINKANVSEALQDVLYDPQTSGGLLISVDEKDATDLLHELSGSIPCAEIIGTVIKKDDYPIILT